MRRSQLIVVVLGLAGSAGANICAVDTVPSATLLFPFVTFDYSHPIDGETTIISITNMSFEAQVAHVTLWTDLGEPILNFNLLFTGYDIIRFSIGDVLIAGRLPVTVSSAHTGNEGFQDRGPMSSANTLFSMPPPTLDPPAPTNTLGTRCAPDNPAYPGNYATPIPQGILDLFQGWLQASQTVPRFHSDDCASPYENPYVPTPTPWFETRDSSTAAWMFLTVDVIDTCHHLFPDGPGYFLDQARTDNVRVGDVMWRLPGASAAAPAVHLEADTDLGEVASALYFGTGIPVSFYARYAYPNNGVSDYREPLPTAWAMRYEGIATDYVATDILTWRGSTYNPNPIDMELQGSDPLNPDQLVATNCLAYTYYAWDEDENVVSVAVPDIEINQLPLATQRVSAESFDLPSENGWVLFAWPPANWTSAAAGSPDIWQTWMGTLTDFPGMGRMYRAGVPTANIGCFSDQTRPSFGVDYDYVDGNGYRVSPSAARTRNEDRTERSR